MQAVFRFPELFTCQGSEWATLTRPADPLSSGSCPVRGGFCLRVQISSFFLRCQALFFFNTQKEISLLFLVGFYTRRGYFREKNAKPRSGTPPRPQIPPYQEKIKQVNI